eukprot:c23619_g2_i1 orf=236-562(+)
MNIWNWRIMAGAVMMGDKLRCWEQVSRLCPWCKSSRETTVHLFWACPMVMGYWWQYNRLLKRVFGCIRISAHMVLLGKCAGLLQHTLYGNRETSFVLRRLCRNFRTTC